MTLLEVRPSPVRLIHLVCVLSLVACAPARGAANRPHVEGDLASAAIMSACRDAPVLEYRGTTKLAFDSETRVLAVRVHVDARHVHAERDPMKGDGEVGFRGSFRGLEFHVVDATGKEMSGGRSQACFDHHARLPDAPGIYCVALVPQDARENPAIEVDYAARQHFLGLVQMPEDEVRDNIDSVCGDTL